MTAGITAAEVERAACSLTDRLTRRLEADDADPAKGLAQLVLTVVELLRQVVERQALHRVESGSLSDEQVERLGRALMALDDRMGQLREVFGVTEDELNLDLGPLGRLL